MYGYCPEHGIHSVHKIRGGATADELKQLIRSNYAETLAGRFPENPRLIIKVGQAGKSLKEMGLLTVEDCAMVKSMMDTWVQAGIGRPIIQITAPFWGNFDCQSLGTDQVEDMEDDPSPDVCPICYTEEATCKLGYYDSNLDDAVHETQSRVCATCIQQMCNQRAETSWVDQDTGGYWELGVIACKDPITRVPVNVYMCPSDDRWQWIPVPETRESNVLTLDVIDDDDSTGQSGMEDLLMAFEELSDAETELYEASEAESNLDIGTETNLDVLENILQEQFDKYEILVEALEQARENQAGSDYIASLDNTITPIVDYISALQDKIADLRESSESTIHMNLSNQGLTGRLRDDMFETLTNVVTIDLSDNEITAPLPSSLFRLTRLEVLNLSQNPLGGHLDERLGMLRNMSFLDLSYCNLSGGIPDFIGNLTSLSILNLSHNQLDGPINPILNNLPNLSELRLENNRLSGTIPDFDRLTQLKDLNLSNNHLNGSIPFSLGLLNGLNKLYLESNQLSGEVPTSFHDTNELTELVLADNQLSGSVAALFTMRHLRYLNLEQNQFSGNLNEELSAESVGTEFTIIDLGNNDFSGIIPDAFRDMRKPERLVLDNNDFEGSVPGFLSSLPLTTLALQENRLSSIPRHVVENTYEWFDMDPEVRIR